MEKQIKQKFNIEKDVKKELVEIEKIVKSSEDDDVKYESIKAILHELADEITAAKIDTLLESRTGFLDSKFGEEFIKKEMESAKRYKSKFTIAILDVDFLKYINDSFGHVAGTKVILALAGVIKKRVRRADIVCRYGGDEFLIVFTDTPFLKAGIAIERIQKDVKKLLVDRKVKVSVSIGVAEFDGKQRISAETLIKLADNELYKDKRQRVNLNLDL